MKYIKNLSVLFINLLFYFFVFSFFSSRAYSLLVASLNNFSNDLSNIGFQYVDNVSTNFIVIIIAVLNTLFLVYFTNLNYFKNSPEKIIIELIKFATINAGVFTFTLYIFRLFNLPRSIIILSLIFFPIIFGLWLFLIGNIQKFSFSRKGVAFSVLTILVFGSIVFFTSRSFDSATVSVQQGTTSNEQGILNFDLGVTSDSGELVCNPWSGSDNFVSCLYGVEIAETISIDLQINNISIFNDEIYLIVETGKVLKVEGEGYSEFLNIEDKVLYKDGGEEGFFDIAFHPSGEYFLISYSNLNNALEVDKYFIRNDQVTFDKVLFDVPNNQCCHFAGTLQWSDYFEGFLLSVGDMEANNASVLNSESLNTTSLRGKVILLESEKKIYSPKINSVNLYEPPQNIVAYGLRNPWQMMEYDGKLIIPDVGNQNIEELNIIPYEEFPNGCKANVYIQLQDGQETCDVQNAVPLGWPIFEGPFFAKELNAKTGGDLLTDEENVTELYIWYEEEDNTYAKADEFLIETSKRPSVYYNHQPGNGVYRAAIIGGDVISNEDSYYNNFYFFTDYVTLEIFAYDMIEDRLYVFPMINSYNTNPTSLAAHPTKKDVLIIALKSGQILEISLPELPKLEQ